ncbi:simple sugar transport system permease protein [Clostridium pascui]|uniref:ABC transporter permease n=1 Tax=Clostridium pascui TaxID=46609 RepID=UPI00195CC65E|nr:ABC transporter permease [Clostridium pascui]MBM7870382.1 simple sugar transport system permease protein [Clostridium pascui]
MSSKKIETQFEVIRTFVAILLAMTLAFLIILGISKQPINAITTLFTGPFSSIRRFGNVIEMSIPFIFTGLSVCVMFQAKQFNMISEGAFFIGGVAASFIAVKVILPMGIHPIVAILFGGLIGALAGFIPGILKTKWNANELVSSLMLNYVCLYLGIYVINNIIRDPNSGFMASFIFNKTAVFQKIIPGTRIHAGTFVAILFIILTYLFMYRSKWGYALRMTGLNENFAKYSGINTKRVILYSQLLGGFIAGLGGGTEVLGMYQRFQWQSLPGYGFDGIIVAILARNNPILVPVAAVFLAYLRVGADIMARMTDVPSEVISVIQAIIIILIAANRFLAKWKHKKIVKYSQEQLAAKEGK